MVFSLLFHVFDISVYDNVRQHMRVCEKNIKVARKIYPRVCFFELIQRVVT